MKKIKHLFLSILSLSMLMVNLTPIHAAQQQCVHNYMVNIQPPTCTSNGVITLDCRKCLKLVTIQVSGKKDHDYSYKNYSSSQLKGTCTRCGATTYINKTGNHDYVTDSETLPTCTQPGSRTTRCINHGERYTVQIPISYHKVTVSSNKLPTCTTDGYSEKVYCSTCGKVFYDPEVYYALGHQYEETSRNGNTIYYKCKTCGIQLTSSQTNGWKQIGEYWYFYENGQKVTSWKQINGNWYYFDGNGVMATGFRTIAKNYYYFKENGVMATGLVNVDDKTYLFSENGYALKGTQEYDGMTLHINDNYVVTDIEVSGNPISPDIEPEDKPINLPEPQKEGLVFDNNKLYYYDNGMKTGWVQVDGYWYYFASDGAATKGWYKENGHWYYLNDDYVMEKGLTTIDGKLYYLNNYMKKGWQQVDNTWYYFDEHGAALTGWLKYNNHWYYLNSNYKMATGFITVNGKLYHLASNGAMQTGWQKIDGFWYLLNTSGEALNGWQKVNNVWYYIENYRMVTGWKKINDIWYYLKSNGAMAKSETLLIDGKYYKFDSSGKWVK